jgi:fructokinase
MMIRFGVDFGGTKIEAAALDAGGRFLARVRAPNPGAYEPAIGIIRAVLEQVEIEAGAHCERLGIGMPGSLSPRTGLIRNANSVWLNGRPFGADLQTALERPVRLANDANCLALSEAVDGAGEGARVVFAAILGTGCGGGLTVEGRLIEGANGIAGEWGHTPLPWPTGPEVPGPLCWCGRRGCLETYVSGTGLARDHQAAGGAALSAEEIIEAAHAGEPWAADSLDHYVDRLGRGLAVIAGILDPDVIVLGGGLSNVEALYDRLPGAVATHVFSDVFETPIRPAAHGDSSGVRGAAWLWPPEDDGEP